jgi:hypothetical protein
VAAVVAGLGNGSGPVSEVAAGSRQVRGYVVFVQVESQLWRLIGNVDHRPGRTARAERAEAVRDATGSANLGEGVYAALPRDQWHLVRHD